MSGIDERCFKKFFGFGKSPNLEIYSFLSNKKPKYYYTRKYPTHRCNWIRFNGICKSGRSINQSLWTTATKESRQKSSIQSRTHWFVLSILIKTNSFEHGKLNIFLNLLPVTLSGILRSWDFPSWIAEFEFVKFGDKSLWLILLRFKFAFIWPCTYLSYLIFC